MGYKLLFTAPAKKQIEKLDAKQKAILKSWLMKNLENCEHPKAVANSKKLENVVNGWQWRVGAYRILGIIQDHTVTIAVFKVGHRSDVYRKL